MNTNEWIDFESNTNELRIKDLEDKIIKYQDFEESIEKYNQNILCKGSVIIDSEEIESIRDRAGLIAFGRAHRLPDYMIAAYIGGTDRRARIINSKLKNKSKKKEFDINDYLKYPIEKENASNLIYWALYNDAKYKFYQNEKERSHKWYDRSSLLLYDMKPEFLYKPTNVYSLNKRIYK